jgi:hypothetical protein
LISIVALPVDMEYLQLRVATDGSPTPYFHPTLRFLGYSKLRSLNIIDVNTISVLRSVGNALFWADEDARLPLNAIFAGWSQPKMLNLKHIDLRGFSKLGFPARSLWRYISPRCLTDLTLEIGPSFQADDYRDFWEQSAAAGVQPASLRTNMICEGLTDFLCSFTGLEVLLLMPCLLHRTLEPISPFLGILASEHSKSLRVLSVQPQGVNKREYLLDRNLLMPLSMTCTHLQELGFGILEHNQVNLEL